MGAVNALGWSSGHRHRDHPPSAHIHQRRYSIRPLVLVCVVVVGGCGGSDKDGSAKAPALDRNRSAAAIELADAAVATADLGSFQVEVTADDREVWDYQAPDRVHIRQPDATGPMFEQINIGRMQYTRLPTDQETFTRITTDWPFVRGLLDVLDSLKNVTSAVRDGPLIRFSFREERSGSVDGEASLTDDKVSELVLRYPKAPKTIIYRFSMFGSAPPVLPPGADHIADPSKPPPCGADGSPPPGSIVCVGRD